MKRLIYTFALLFVTLGAMAHSFPSTAHIYFAKPDGWTGSYLYFFIGNSGWSSEPKSMTKISNTSLYYAKQTSWNGWGYDNWAVFNTTGAWSGSGGSLHDRKNYAANSTWVGNSAISTYNLVPLESTNATTNSDYKFLNKTHTINSYVDDVESSEGGTIKATSYKLSSADATSATNGTTSIEAAYTATIKLTATVNDGYEFIGWYIDGAQKSSNKTYSYTAPNSAKTISAKFRKLAVAEPRIVSFSASIEEFDLGQFVTFNVEVENADKNDVVFKIGEDEIENPWTPTEGGVYTITANLDGATSKSVNVTVYVATVYFDNTNSKWENVYAYCWNEDGSKNAVWPGVKLDKHAGGGDVYIYKTTQLYEKIIFNKVDKQTENFDFVNEKTYSIPIFNVGDTLYFSSDQGAFRYAAYFFGPNGDTWCSLEQVYKNIYRVEIPEGLWNGLIFCSMKKNTTTNNWDNKEGQTGDLKNEGKNWYFWGTKQGVESYWRNFENLIYAGQKLYFKPDSNWEEANARFAAYYWDIIGENKWVDCEYNEEEHVYEVIAPTKGDGVNQIVWTNIQYVRMNPNFSENNWDNDWNKTENLVFDGVNDLFIIKLTERNGEDWNWNSADTKNWVSLSTCFRDYIFFQPNANEASNRFSVYFWNPFGQNCWIKFKPLTGYDGIYYVVVPEGLWTGANICSMNPETEKDSWDKVGENYVDLLRQTNNLTYHVNALLYKVPNVWDNNVIGDENWCVFEVDTENMMEIKNGVDNGAYYQAKKYTLLISGADVNKWHWISLPYDVNVKDIKSNDVLGRYGTDFIMKRYDTASRAAWEGEQPPMNDNTWVQLENTDILKAGRGYILGINNSLTEGVTLIFPANSYFHIVEDQVDSENENIEARNSDLNINSNWHLIGTGLYADTKSSSKVNFVAYPDESGNDYTYHYLNSDEDLKYHETTLKSTLGMYKAFFVQYGGEYSFSKVAMVQNMAPRRARSEEVIEQYYINIEGEKDITRTAIFLAEDGSNDYVVGKDFLHFGVTGKTTQLYTKQGSRLLSFNHLKREDCVVELGGYIINEGEYTISLTDNGDASVVLVDNYTGKSIDLSLESYRFTTEKGSLDGRFSLVISYVVKDVTTQIGNQEVGNLVVSNSGEVTLVDGLVIGDRVWIYDALGRCIGQFIAESEQQELSIDEGVYVLKTSMESVKFIVW